VARQILALRLFSLLFLLTAPFIDLQPAQAHGVVALRLPTPSFKTTAIPTHGFKGFKPLSTGLSGSQKTTGLFYKSIVSNGVVAGVKQSTSGGILTNGVLTGQLYGIGFGQPGQWVNEGSFVVTFSGSQFNIGGPGGNTLNIPATPNFLQFSNPPSPHAPLTPAVMKAEGRLAAIPLSGSMRVQQSMITGLTRVSVFQGKQSAPLTGGQLEGTFFDNTVPGASYPYSPYLFVFGKNPLNTSSILSIPMSPSTFNNYINYGSITKNISSGQFFNSWYFNTPNPKLSFGGYFQAVGNNQFNVGPTFQLYDLRSQPSFIQFR
jgi:hypothetical protein